MTRNEAEQHIRKWFEWNLKEFLNHKERHEADDLKTTGDLGIVSDFEGWVGFAECEQCDEEADSACGATTEPS